MSVASFLSQTSATAFSFEILPPLRGGSVSQLYSNVEKLLQFNPAYINITTHRMDVVYKEVSKGNFQRLTLQKRPGTTSIAIALKLRYKVPTVPHIICSGYSKFELENELIDLSYMGITDLLVLRGDTPKEEKRFTAVQNGHTHAIELCQQVEDFNKGIMADGSETQKLESPFTYGVAGYPEKHEEAMNFDTDLEYLKQKVDLGASYIVTQMFFDNKKYFDFVSKCRNYGIRVPIIPGIKPLSALTQIELLPKTFHIDFPLELSKELKRCKTSEDVKDLGIEWAITQAKELKERRVPSIHFYSMGAATQVEKIAKMIY